MENIRQTTLSKDRQARGRRRLAGDLGVLAAIAAVSALHYVTDPHAHQLHDIYRRLYYLPIIVGAFHRGILGGVISATLVCLAYLPHAMGHISHDPASNTQKALEMVLYLAVGLTTGTLVSRLTRTQRVLESTAEELHASLDTLRTTEQELIRSARLAAVGRLSAGLAHEIRNPLASIKGSAELLSDEFPAGHKKRRMLDVLVEEAGRLNDVLTRFLTFARPRPIEPGRMELRRELDHVVALVENESAGRGRRFVIDDGMAGGLPVHGDRDQLRQVLINVILNACQAAGTDGEVRISARHAGDMVRVEIADSGPGFTAEALENAFTPFFTTRTEGTGLGLAESHRIIEAHGGRILLTNGAAGGALVVIEIPAPLGS